MANLQIAAALLVAEKLIQWNIRGQTQTQLDVVPADYLFDHLRNMCVCRGGGGGGGGGGGHSCFELINKDYIPTNKSP